MKVTLQLTAHKTTKAKQSKKIIEEFFELFYELFLGIFSKTLKKKNTERIIQEAIDLSKSSMKLAYDLAEKENIDFETALTANDYNNKMRGYNK